MLTYYLSERKDGRILLDRESHGIVLQKVEAPDPSAIRRRAGIEIVDVPQYHESFTAARALVNENGLIQTPEGWFRADSARKEYVRSRIGEAD
jgi:hypothetical protein